MKFPPKSTRKRTQKELRTGPRDEARAAPEDRAINATRWVAILCLSIGFHAFFLARISWFGESPREAMRLERDLLYVSPAIRQRVGGGGPAGPAAAGGMARLLPHLEALDGSAGGGGGLPAPFDGVASLSFTRYASELIDNNLDYPEEFQASGIEGAVQARLVFSPDGRVDWHHSVLTSSSRFLKLCVRKSLARAFVDPIPPSLLRSMTPLVCEFSFLTGADKPGLQAPAWMAPRDSLEFHLLGQGASQPLTAQPLFFAQRTGQPAGIVPAMNLLELLDALRRMRQELARRAGLASDPLDRWRRDPLF